MSFFKSCTGQLTMLVVGLLMVYHGIYTPVTTYQKRDKQVQEMGVRFPRVVLAQGLLETGMFTSNIFVHNNNWLGMKCALYRETTCIGTQRGHALYVSTYDCLKDYYLWQSKYLPRYEKKYGPVRTEYEYIEFLIRMNYAEDENYGKKVLNRLKLIKSLENA